MDQQNLQNTVQVLFSEQSIALKNKRNFAQHLQFRQSTIAKIELHLQTYFDKYNLSQVSDEDNDQSKAIQMISFVEFLEQIGDDYGGLLNDFHKIIQSEIQDVLPYGQKIEAIVAVSSNCQLLASKLCHYNKRVQRKLITICISDLENEDEFMKKFADYKSKNVMFVCDIFRDSHHMNTLVQRCKKCLNTDNFYWFTLFAPYSYQIIQTQKNQKKMTISSVKVINLSQTKKVKFIDTPKAKPLNMYKTFLSNQTEIIINSNWTNQLIDNSAINNSIFSKRMVDAQSIYQSKDDQSKQFQPIEQENQLDFQLARKKQMTVTSGLNEQDFSSQNAIKQSNIH